MMCTQVVDELLKKKQIDFTKVDKHTEDAKFRWALQMPHSPEGFDLTDLCARSLSDVKAAVAVLEFIFKNAIKYDVGYREASIVWVAQLYSAGGGEHIKERASATGSP